jgi:hypothetical protein
MAACSGGDDSSSNLDGDTGAGGGGDSGESAAGADSGAGGRLGDDGESVGGTDSGAGGLVGGAGEAAAGEASGGAGTDEQVCQPTLKECADEAVERTCSDDGMSWLETPCEESFVCEQGSCRLPNGWACIPDSLECVDDATLRSCKSDGSGWESSACLPQTECRDGACWGSVCAVGATRCAPEFSDPGSYFEAALATAEDPEVAFYYAAASIPAGRMERCTDGETWSEQPCEAGEVCLLSGVDPVAAERYRTELAAFVTDLRSSTSSVRPEPPAVPSNSVASCETPSCPDLQAETIYGYSADDSQWCGDPRYEGPFDIVIAYGSYSRCEGIAPYAPLELEVVACEGQTRCRYGDIGASCQEVQCGLRESRCLSATTFEECAGTGLWYEVEYTCPGAGTCTDTGEFPRRAALCEGGSVD